jgi:hypothetical protein
MLIFENFCRCREFCLECVLYREFLPVEGNGVDVSTLNPTLNPALNPEPFTLNSKP